MIPIRLKIAGFLSYRDPVEVDFTSFELACISGMNGAGKSSLLDAITWSLFGQARKRDEAVVNANSDLAEVSLTFAYEENIYRVQRILPRGKSTVLEFQILDGELPDGDWRPLSERTLRETQARIERILHLDYDTFINASFFLQGKADQFTQQRPADRKRILSSVLGLETWETYREHTADRRKTREGDLKTIDGRLEEINAELAEENIRTARLSELEKQLEKLAATRKSQETLLNQTRQMKTLLAEQRKRVDELAGQLEKIRQNRGSLRARLAAREAEYGAQAALLERAAEVESAYQAWEAARADLEKWETTAAQFREAEKQRQPHLDAINAERARLAQERETLLAQKTTLDSRRAEIDALKTQLEAAEKALAEAEADVARRAELDEKLRSQRENLVALDGENKRLKLEMDEIKTRIGQISEIEGAACPLCGQPLSDEHRQSTLEQLNQQGKDMGDRWRANKTQMETLTKEVDELTSHLGTFTQAEDERVARAGQVSSLTEKLEAATQAAAAWERQGAKRLAEVEKLLEKEAYAPEARAALAKIDSKLAALGYDAAAHDATRRAEGQGRAAESEFRKLEAARAALAPLEREVGELRIQIETLQAELAKQEDTYAEAAASLAQSEAQAPDLESAERAFYDLQEQENRLGLEVGGARQLVAVLDSRRSQKKQYVAQREHISREIGRHKTLERAFGKDGVPALLIEQALPQIEEKANELLERLSNGAMSVRFVTQAEYKDKKREDLKETLDIQISDGAGTRDYEMFSGGEAFRVNFAIRLALSEVLARRTGARLQTLVIDEGFGSQDVQGRQRLIEAINLVKDDFAKVLVITHLEELKEAFPNRIEVEKTERGSSVRVL